MIASSVVRVHQHGISAFKVERGWHLAGDDEGERLGRSRGELTMKIHVLTDRKDRPAVLKLKR